MTVRIALVGAGAFGRQHLPGLANLHDAQVAVAVDADRAAADTLAAAGGVAETATDLSDVLTREDIDAVALATPTPLHARRAIACLQAGKHIEGGDCCMGP